MNLLRRSLTSGRNRRVNDRRKPARSRLRLEWLEDRLAPAVSTFQVANLADSGTGSFRWAVQQANNAQQAIIHFAPGLNGTISLKSELAITANLRIDASVATGTTGAHKITVAAPKAGGRDFDITKGVQVTFVGDPNGSISGSTTGFVVQGGNHVGNGAGIYAANPLASLVLIGLDVTSNNATANGGGIYDAGTLGLYNTTVESNSAVTKGGGVYVGKLFGAYNSTITDNKVTNGSGGGVFEAGTGSSMTFVNDLVKTNHAFGSNGNGGGVWAQYNLTATGSTFLQNTATKSGGAIFSNDGSVTLLSSSVLNNSAGNNGGGVWADHNITLNGSVADGNTAGGNGGALFSVNGQVFLNNAVVQGNQALGTVHGAGFGGGIYSGGDVIIANGSQVGGISTGGGSSYTRNQPAVLGNTSNLDGGGVWARLNVLLTNSSVDGNTSILGSGGGIIAGVDVRVGDGHVDGNTANNGNGGGIADASGNVYLTSAKSNSIGGGSSVSGNQAIDGAGVWDRSGAIYIDSQTLIDSNVASHDGGGIWTAGVLNLMSSTVSNNTAIHGGGIAADGADAVTIFQSRIIFNTATAPSTDAAGGGILAHNVADLAITYSTIASNQATSGNGGGVAFVADPGVAANVGIDDSTFGGFTDPEAGVMPNVAGGLGGAMYVNNVTVDIVHVTFNDNVSFGTTSQGEGFAGSAIYADLGSNVTLQDTLVDDTNHLADPTSNPGSSELLDSATSGLIHSAGANLVSDFSWSNVDNWNVFNNDIGNGVQDLGPLQFNQLSPPGPTFTETYALVAGGQAIKGGDDLGPLVDQNGRLRPVGAASDIGAVQYFLPGQSPHGNSALSHSGSGSQSGGTSTTSTSAIVTVSSQATATPQASTDGVSTSRPVRQASSSQARAFAHSVAQGGGLDSDLNAIGFFS